MKNLLTTTALTLALTTGAFAASHVAYTFGDGREAAAPMYGETPFTVDSNFAAPEGFEAYTDQLTMEDIEDARVYSTVDNEDIGSVDEVLITNGQIESLVLEVGGFLGIGDANVAVPLDQLQIVRNEGLGEARIYVNATEEQLESYPRYEEAAATDMGVAPVDGDNTMMAADGEETAVVTEQPAETETVVVTDAETTAPTTDETVVVTQNDTATTDTMATPGAATGTYMTMRGEPAAQPVFGEDRFEVDPNYQVEGYERFEGGYDQMLTEGDVEEAPLYSAVTGEEIGEVEDAITENGVVTALVLDIGGFLGIAEHTITVAPDQVSYVRDPGVLSSVRVYINATQEQLEAYPSYNADL